MDHHTERFCVYPNDPIMMFLNKHHIHWSVTVLIFLLLFIGTKLIINIITGTLTSPDLLDNFYSDLWFFPPLNGLRIIVKNTISFVGISPPEYLVVPPTTSSYEIPYLRDYIDIAVMTVSAFHMALIQRQWYSLSNIMSDLRKNKVLDHYTIPDEKYQDIIHEYNQYFRKKSLYITSILISALIVVIVLIFFSQNGIYPSLSPSRVDKIIFEQNAYDHWWSHNLIVLVINGIIWIIILYYIIMHNIIGRKMVLMFSQIRKQYSNPPERFLFSPQLGYFDGLGGLKPLQSVMGQVYTSLFASGFCLLLGFFYMPSGFATILTPLIILFLLVIPFFAFLPTRWIHQDWRKWKEKIATELFSKREELFNRANESIYNPSLLGNENRITTQLLVIRERYKEIIQMPTSLFSARRVIIIIIVYALPVIAFICNVLTNS